MDISQNEDKNPHLCGHVTFHSIQSFKAFFYTNCTIKIKLVQRFIITQTLGYCDHIYVED